jgi:hypothetical protein
VTLTVRPPTSRETTREVVGALTLLVIGILLAPALAAAPTVWLVLAGGALVVVTTAFRPVGAVVGYIALAPLLAGLDRGAFVPGLRLDEVLLVPILGGLAVVVLRRWAWSDWALPRLHGLDWVVLAVAFTSSVSTLLWMYARGREITTDDLLYALTLWKLAIVYAVVRLMVRDVHAVRSTLAAIMVSAGLVGIVGVLQGLRVGPVLSVLAALFPVTEGYQFADSRASSTVGNPMAYGDVMLYAAVVAAALALWLSGRARFLWLAAAALALCALASGEVSVVVGLLLAGIVFAIATRTVPEAVLAGSGVLAVAAVTLQPILAARLAHTDPQTGLPTSWVGPYGRLTNLQTYFLPDLAADHNWVLGVQTASRVPGTGLKSHWVWIESGYVWALWTGGVPLLVAVLALLVLTARTGRRLAASGEPMAGAVGSVLTTVAWMLAGLLVFDPHLTFRGAGTFLFVLLAVGVNLELGVARRGGFPTIDGRPLGRQPAQARPRPVG